MNNFVRREFQRAAAALPTMRNVMVDVDAIPVEEVQEASQACAAACSNRVGLGGHDGEEEREDEEEWGDEDEEEEEEEEFIEWGYPKGRSHNADDSDSDFDPANL